MGKRKKEEIDMRGVMIDLPNIENTKGNNLQPQISKMNLPQTCKKTPNFEIMPSVKWKRAIKCMVGSPEI